MNAGGRIKGKLAVSRTDFGGEGIESNTDGCHFPAGTNSQRFFRSFLCKVPWSRGDVKMFWQNKILLPVSRLGHTSPMVM